MRRLSARVAALVLCCFAFGAPAFAQLVPGGAGPARPDTDILGGAPRAQVIPMPLGQMAQADTVADIVVEGNQRVEAGTVVSYMSIAPGDRFEDERVDRSLKALFATGLFSDVTIRRQGATLVVRVVENPIVNRIAFEGNSRLTDDTLGKEAQLRPRQVFTRAKVQSDVQRLLQLYRRQGRFGATIEPKVIQLPQNRVDLVFEIEEGPATRIERIRFIGNKTYSDSRLREAISTRETAWWRFLSSDDSYDPDRLNFDRELLRRFYLARGFADFRVASAVAELTPNRDGFFITFSIDEGERYRIGKASVASSIPDVNTAQLEELIATEPGDLYNADRVERTVQDITFELGKFGYAFTDVRPQIDKRREGNLIDIAYQVSEGPRVYVERIDISGNSRTLDKVVRREFRLAEGDAFNAVRLRESRSRLRGLNFFQSVDVKEERGSAPDKLVLKTEVQEKSTGELSIGAGFSTSDSLLGNIELRERNLLGRGYDFRLGTTLSFRRQQFDHSFTDPAFLDRDLLGGYDLQHRRLNLQNRSGYDLTSSGGGLRFGFPLTDAFRALTYYRVRYENIENVQAGASRVVKQQEGGTVTSLVGYSLTYDKRDDILEPTDGFLLRFGNDFAGLGGTERFVRSSAGYTHFFAPFEDIVLSQAFEVAHVLGVADDVRLNNRFYPGGDTFRGFKQGGVGARDRISGDALGANIYYTSTTEAEFPVGLPKEIGVRGRLFGIVGSGYQVDDTDINVLESSTLRASAGFGLSWKSPFGPIRLDFAVPLLREDFDQTEFFRFSFGTRF